MEHKKGEPHMDKRGNIFSRNMRLFAAIMTLIEALVLTSFTGCAGKKVDYGVDTEVKAVSYTHLDVYKRQQSFIG